MASETKIQEFVHKLEVGGWVKWIRLAVLLAGVAYVMNLWFYRENGFKGLNDAKAIEQAQVSRELARGNGFSTKMIRPAALWQFQKQKGLEGAPAVEKFPDTYHAPVPIAVHAVVFKAMDGLNDFFLGMSRKGIKFFDALIYEKEMSTKSVIYAYDKMIAFTQVIFFLLAVVVNYFIAKRLFDRRLALLGVGLMLLCDMFWQFSMTGLPQMLLLFVFSLAIYCLVRAVELRVAATPVADGEPGSSDLLEPEEAADIAAPQRNGFFSRLSGSLLFWLAACAAMFGLLALSHGLTIFIFVGALLFAGLYFRPFWRNTGVMLGVFLLVYSPWLVRNYQVCGSPVGLGWYSALYQVRGTESAVMRSMDPPLEGVSPTVFRDKVQAQTIGQFGALPRLLGGVILAPIFFVALMHLFRRRETAVFRWGVLLMWLAAVVGMSVFGLEGLPYEANNLHVLFIPLMTFYGLAFLLVMWSRLEINVRLLRIAFITLLFILSSLSFITNFVELHATAKGRVQWPPYIPPYIAILADWTTPREMIASDMPWGVAWYADRTSLWLPLSIRTFIELNDYNVLQKPIVGMYLTPISGNQAFIRDIVKGEYKEWAPFVMRNANMKNFPLRAVTALPVDNECVFYADRDRWSVRED